MNIPNENIDNSRYRVNPVSTAQAGQVENAGRVPPVHTRESSDPAVPGGNEPVSSKTVPAEAENRKTDRVQLSSRDSNVSPQARATASSRYGQASPAGRGSADAAERGDRTAETPATDRNTTVIQHYQNTGTVKGRVMNLFG